MITPAYPQVKISGNPCTKEEARRWIANGIELAAIDCNTRLPVAIQNGTVFVTGQNWSGMATIVNKLVVAIH